MDKISKDLEEFEKLSFIIKDGSYKVCKECHTKLHMLKKLNLIKNK